MISTPRYVFHREEIIKGYKRIEDLLPHCEIFYACKANLEIGVAQVLQEIDAGFEIASIGEFDKLLSINVSVERIICGLPIKTCEQIEYMYHKGCRYFVFDSLREYEKLVRLAPKAKKVLRVYIVDLAPHCIEYGMTIDKIYQHNQGERPFLKTIDGLSFHVSENKSIDNLLKVLECMETLLPLLDQTKEQILNIGGSYRLDVPNDFYPTLNQQLLRLKETYNLKLFAEPGGVVINQAGKVITRVVMVKEREGFSDVYIDAGIPTGLLRKPGSIKLVSRSAEPTSRKIYRFIDTTCLHKPLFQTVLRFALVEDDLVEFTDYGAYTVCYNNEFHSWSKPEVIIE